MAAEHARDPNPADHSAILEDGAVSEEGVDGERKNDTIGKDGDQQVSDENVMGGVLMPRKRLLRRWPSSADVGMITDGR